MNGSPKEPRDVGLLDLRAELAGQESDWKAQAADYTAVIEILADQKAAAVSAPLRRLYRRRGDAYVSLQRWQEAVDDYAHVISPETTDAPLLSNRARAHEALRHWDSAAADWARAAAENPEGAIWLVEFAGRLVTRGQVALVKPQLEMARALYDRSLAVAPDGTPVAAKLAHALDRKLATAYESAGLQREAVAHLAKLHAANPHNHTRLLKVACLQAWFRQDTEFADSCRRGLPFAKNVTDPQKAEQSSKACCLLPAINEAQLEAVLTLARKAVELGKDSPWLPWYQMSLGMAEYRNGHFAAADAALIAAAKCANDRPDRDNTQVARTSAFYRALSLFRLGKEKDARQLVTEAAVNMKPLPANEQNPLANGATYDDLIMWLAYKEAKDMIKFGAPPPPRRHPTGTDCVTGIGLGKTLDTTNRTAVVY